MVNKYCNLTGTNKIKDEYQKITDGFTSVETDLTTILNETDLDPNKDPEVTNARVSTVKSETFSTVGLRLEDIEQEHVTHEADTSSRAINIMSPPSPLVAAIGDGVTDDSVSIQNIINAVEAAGGGTVFFPHNTYLAKDLLIPSNVNLIGAYNNAILKLPNGAATSTAIVKNKDTINGNHDILIDGIVFDGNKANQVNGTFGLYFDKCQYITIQNCTVQNVLGNWGSGVVFTGENLSKYNRVLNSNFMNLVGCDAIFLQGLGHYVAGCYVDTIGDTAVAIDATTNVRVIGNVFRNCDAQAIGSSGSTNYAIIANNTIENCRIGINFYYQASPVTTETCKNILIEGNTILSSTLQAIYIAATPTDYSNNILISENIVKSSAYRGVELIHCKACNVNNNSVKDCGDAGIFVNSSSHIKVLNNICNDNITAGIYFAASATYQNLFSMICNNLCTCEKTPIVQAYGIILDDSGAVNDFEYCLISNNILKNNSASFIPGASTSNTSVNNIV